MSKRIIVFLVLALMLISTATTYYYIYLPSIRKAVKLVVATRLSKEEAEAIRSVFLSSQICKEYGITDIEFRKIDMALWKDMALSGEIDAFFVGEIPVYNYLLQENALKKIDLEELKTLADQVDDKFKGYGKSGDLYWIGIGVAVYGFILNENFIDEYNITIPSSWENITDPNFGKSILAGEKPISFPLPSKSGTAKTILHAILQKYGWEKGWETLTILGSLSRFVDSSERARDEAAEGIVALAPAYIGYGIYAENVSRGAAKFIIPQSEGILYISPAAVAFNSPHPREAQAFIFWLLSDDGQREIAKLFYYIPVRKVSGVEFVRKYYEDLIKNAYEYNRTLAERVESAMITYFEAAIADPDAHEMISEIWEKILKEYSRGRMSLDELNYLKVLMGKPLKINDPETGEQNYFTIQFAIKLSEDISKNPTLKDALYNEIKEAALQRYTSILKELGTG